MPKIRIQNITVDTDEKLGADILAYYQNGDGGTKSVRIRNLIEVGYAIQQISPDLFLNINSMAVRGKELSLTRLSETIKFVQDMYGDELVKPPQEIVDKTTQKHNTEIEKIIEEPVSDKSTGGFKQMRA